MTPALKLTQVHKHFGALHALKGIDLAIEQGEFFALLGPNGAGKSTLINLMAGLLRPTSGNLSVMGFDVVSQYQQARHALGVVPQELVFDPFFNVREMLRFQAGYFGKGPENDAWIDEIIECLGLADKAHTNMRRLSGGMKRRLTIARALVSEPDILMLDEPTTGLDPQARHILWDRLFRLKEKGVTLVITTHFMDEAEQLCERLIVIDRGKIMAEGSPTDLIKRYSSKEVLEVRFGSEKNEELAEKLKDKCERLEVLPDRVLLYAEDAEKSLEDIMKSGMHPKTSLVRRSSLEDVFLRLTGRTLVE